MSIGGTQLSNLNPRVLMGLGIAALILLFLLLSSLFTVNQTQQALVLQFGNPVRVVQEPGLHMKVPFIQQAEYFEKRVLDFDAPSVELVLGDQKRLVVDAFARYRIRDALRFRQSVGTETAFRGRLEPIIFSALRSVLGEAPLFTLLSEERNQIMNRIRGEANRALAGFGVELVDLAQLCERSDVLAIHAPVTDETRGMLDAGLLARLRDGAIVVNTARSAVIDMEALTAELVSGRLRAGLDVFEAQPKLDERLVRLAQRNQVTLLPHMASATREARLDMGEKVIINIRTFMDGHKPPDRILPGRS